jgi:hypothetical protein
LVYKRISWLPNPHQRKEDDKSFPIAGNANIENHKTIQITNN